MAMTLVPMSAVVATLSDRGTNTSASVGDAVPAGYPARNALGNVTRCRQWPR